MKRLHHDCGCQRAKPRARSFREPPGDPLPQVIWSTFPIFDAGPFRLAGVSFHEAAGPQLPKGGQQGLLQKRCSSPPHLATRPYAVLMQVCLFRSFPIPATSHTPAPGVLAPPSGSIPEGVISCPFPLPAPHRSGGSLHRELMLVGWVSGHYSQGELSV